MKKLFGLTLAASLLFTSTAFAEKERVEILTMPFGTASYSQDMALESLFKEVDSWVELLMVQTPGAMYVTRYNYENLEKMREGKVPFTTAAGTVGITKYIAQGLPPYQDYPSPDSLLLGVTSTLVIPFITFNEDIKSPADFVGKKVGVAERARPNMGILPNKPVHDYGYGGYDKVDWQHVGFANSKDAMLNNSIDVHLGNASGTVKVDEDGNFYMEKVTVDPSVMEVISSGRDWHIVSEDPEVLRKGYDPTKDLVFSPILLKAGAIQGLEEDVWVKGDFMIYSIDKEVSDEVVEEIVYQIWKNKERLAVYYDGFSYIADSPYIDGIGLEWWHPGVFKAMKKLGLPLPEGVVVD